MCFIDKRERGHLFIFAPCSGRDPILLAEASIVSDDEAKAKEAVPGGHSVQG